MALVSQDYTSDARIDTVMSLTNTSDAVLIDDHTPEIDEAIDIPLSAIVSVESVR